MIIRSTARGFRTINFDTCYGIAIQKGGIKNGTAYEVVAITGTGENNSSMLISEHKTETEALNAYLNLVDQISKHTPVI